jgi:hypothetical protein
LRELLGIEETREEPHAKSQSQNHNVGAGVVLPPLGNSASRGGSSTATPTKSGFGLGSKSVSSPVAKERLLVVEQEQTRWVFPVDEVDGVYRTQSQAFEDLPHTVKKSVKFYSRAIFSHQDRKVGMLSQERIFQALEKTIR